MILVSSFRQSSSRISIKSLTKRLAKRSKTTLNLDIKSNVMNEFNLEAKFQL